MPADGRAGPARPCQVGMTGRDVVVLTPAKTQRRVLLSTDVLALPLPGPGPGARCAGGLPRLERVCWPWAVKPPTATPEASTRHPFLYLGSRCAVDVPPRLRQSPTGPTPLSPATPAPPATDSPMLPPLLCRHAMPGGHAALCAERRGEPQCQRERQLRPALPPAVQGALLARGGGGLRARLLSQRPTPCAASCCVPFAVAAPPIAVLTDRCMTSRCWMH